MTKNEQQVKEHIGIKNGEERIRKCKFGNSCQKKGDTCKFDHTQENEQKRICRNYKNCKYGQSCKFEHTE